MGVQDRMGELMGQTLGKNGATYTAGTTAYSGSYVFLKVLVAATFTTLTLHGNWDGSDITALPVGDYPMEFSAFELSAGTVIAYKG